MSNALEDRAHAAAADHRDDACSAPPAPARSPARYPFPARWPYRSVAPVNLCPHSRQNLAPGLSGAPQLGHTVGVCASAAALPSGDASAIEALLGAPQLGQYSSPRRDLMPAHRAFDRPHRGRRTFAQPQKQPHAYARRYLPSSSASRNWDNTHRRGPPSGGTWDIPV